MEKKEISWRKRFEDWFYAKYTYNKDCYWIDISYDEVDEMYKELENFISQERYRTKKEILAELLEWESVQGSGVELLIKNYTEELDSLSNQSKLNNK